MIVGTSSYTVCCIDIDTHLSRHDHCYTDQLGNGGREV
jgi:hypothetical protein